MMEAAFPGSWPLGQEQVIRFAYTSRVSSNRVRFERELLDHHRLVFERA